MKEPSTPYIFISYTRAHSDSEFVDRLEVDLHARGYQTWVDRQKIEGGDEWEQRTAAAIIHSVAMLVVLSPAVVASKWVPREIILADEQNVPIIPLLFKPTTVSQMPFRIAGRQYIDFTTDYSAGIKALLLTLSARAMLPERSPRQAVPLQDTPAPTLSKKQKHWQIRTAIIVSLLTILIGVSIFFAHMTLTHTYQHLSFFPFPTVWPSSAPPLFSDSLKLDQQHWRTGGSATINCMFVSGSGYRARGNGYVGPDCVYLANNWDSIAVEVDFAVSQPGDPTQGAVIAIDDDIKGTGYRFSIQPKGQYVLRHFQSFDPATIAQGLFPGFDGSQRHTMGIIAKNNAMALYLDRHRLTVIPHTPLMRGSLILSTYIENGMPVSIDYTNCQVWLP